MSDCIVATSGRLAVAAAADYDDDDVMLFTLMSSVNSTASYKSSLVRHFEGSCKEIDHENRYSPEKNW